jgi:transcriptional regulator with XRE-family HTH domain
MLASFQSETRKGLTQELRDVATSSPTFDRDLAVKIGKCITVRRNFCGLSKQQLGARLGIESMEVEAYEQGEKRMSCRLLLETAKQLKATPRFFFHLA